MREVVQLPSVLAEGPSDRLAVFALLGLGVAELLTSGLLSASDAVLHFPCRQLLVRAEASARQTRR
jgi:hypothetical protein